MNDTRFPKLQREPVLEGQPTIEFLPVFAAFRRMMSDLNASRSALEEATRRTAAVLRNAASGVIAVNDLLAIGVLRAAADLGLHIPTDVSVVGYDDIATASYLVPRLTTVSRDAQNLGRAAVKLLLARIHDPDRPRRRETRPARLIIRESTGHAPSR